VDHEPRVTIGEVELLAVSGTVGDMALAVEAERAAVGIDHGQRIVALVTIGLVERHRQDDALFARELGKPGDRRVPSERPGTGLVPRIDVDAEVWSLEQFLQDDKPGSAPRRDPHQTFDFRQIFIDIVGA